MRIRVKAKECDFCGVPFQMADGSNAPYCSRCSDLRRQSAGRHFRLTSGTSSVFGDYLLSKTQALHMGEATTR